MPITFGGRLQHAWNAFRNKDPTSEIYGQNYGTESYSRPDRTRMFVTSERSIVAAVYNRIAMDVAAVSIQHVDLDENRHFLQERTSGLNYCLTVEANIDQTAKALIQDIVMSLFDEGVVAVVPTDATSNAKTGAYDVLTMRVGRIVRWYPQFVRVRLYNEQTGLQEEITLPKKMVAIIENPLYSVMNESNSTLKRLIRKLALLDVVDEQSSAGKLDIIIQLPYTIKTEAKREQAEQRRKDIEVQLAGSKYGIAYADATERITQLNRPAENNLMTQVQYLTSMLYSQLGLTEDVFTGKADEATMLNYNNRSIIPIVSAIVDEFKRKFLTKTARTQGQSIMYFRDAFSLVPANELADIADKFTRNEILTSNEMRAIIGYKPSSDPSADQLRNKNLNASSNGSSDGSSGSEQDGTEGV